MIKQWKSLARLCEDIDLEPLVAMKLQILLAAQSLPQDIESKSYPDEAHLHAIWCDSIEMKLIVKL